MSVRMSMPLMCYSPTINIVGCSGLLYTELLDSPTAVRQQKVNVFTVQRIAVPLKIK